VTDGKEKYLVKPFKVKVVDTTGAGDAFDAGFLYGLLSGKNLCECAKTGNFIASGCIMSMGARTSLPSLKDLEAHKQV
jgi:ribokinase